ncbi:DUF2851 family protein [Joostella sp.]|uniref:DUF2851 family protein n=1 Tax=Joostella sp. TaxID=2231138 RepID=UPI003A910E11
MKEDFLHYIWKFKKFPEKDLITDNGERIAIISLGQHNLHSGPDFLNAQLRINDLHWVGNVEIHEKSSFWYAHNHENDPAYSNVILHVVWEHDIDVFNKNNEAIPTLALKNIVHSETLLSYNQLLYGNQKFINCEKQLEAIPSFFIDRWMGRLYIDRLQEKSEFIIRELQQCKNDWESILFKMLLRNFGLKINGEAFFEISNKLPFLVIRKNSTSNFTLETLLFGVAGMLNDESVSQYYISLKKEYKYLEKKYTLEQSTLAPEYFKLRPYNFPTIRLSQLAALYSKETNLFQQLMECDKLEGYYKIFEVSASNYWDSHYTFNKESPSKREKKTSKQFINLLIVNTIIPLKFCYGNYKGKDATEEVLNLIGGIKKEKNSIVESFENIGFDVKSALGSQSLLQLYNEYCSENKCLHCEIGVKLIR